MSLRCRYKFVAALLFFTIGASAQSTTKLKDYSYPVDGFAIKFPYDPAPHSDRVHPDFKVYTIRFNQRAAVSIRVIVNSQPCDASLRILKLMAASKNVPVREFSISGRPAWEEKARDRGDGNMVFERYVCGSGRYYMVTLGWPASESEPRLGVEIMDSFRLIK